ncbi:MAG: NADH-quinone oxidoreductase subunit A [Desulfobacterota bacterium]|nr:NADH-quinone oxidoreductase subunit A [Thermodesulfobacteriota bacterium]
MHEYNLLKFCGICISACVGIAAAGLPFLLANLLRPAARNSPRTLHTYECGNLPFGQSWDFRHGIAYYVYALIFLAFEVDILYLFPVATAFDAAPPLRGGVLLIIFVLLLACGLAYAWRTGVFIWSTKRKLY